MLDRGGGPGKGRSRGLDSGLNSDQPDHPDSMKINVARDIVPIGEFKTHASEMLRVLEQTGRPLVITQHGSPKAVVITPEAFEELAYRRFVRDKVKAGIRSAEVGKTRSLAAARDHLKKRIRATATR